MIPPQVQHIIDIYKHANTVKSGRYFTTVNELSDQVPSLRPSTLLSAISALQSIGPITATKIVCEEDKGAVLGALFSVCSNLPLSIARWYPYALTDGIKVPIAMEYHSGSLYLNGINNGDKIVIVDDTLSTGGTIKSLADAINTANAKVVEVRLITEKLDNGERAYLGKHFDFKLSSVIGIRINENGKISVEEVFGKPITSYGR